MVDENEIANKLKEALDRQRAVQQTAKEAARVRRAASADEPLSPLDF